MLQSAFIQHPFGRAAENRLKFGGLLEKANMLLFVHRAGDKREFMGLGH
jgi:hypothetical protein